MSDKLRRLLRQLFDVIDDNSHDLTFGWEVIEEVHSEIYGVSFDKYYRDIHVAESAKAAAARQAEAAMTPQRSPAMQKLKEKRIAAIQAVCDRDFPKINDLDLDRQAAAMRRCETDPEVWAIDDEIRALRLKEAAGDAD